MKRTLFLVEGKTEQIFLRYFLEKIASYQDTRIEFKILSKTNILAEEVRGAPLEDCSFLIQIVNMQGDESVISYITENIEAISKKNYDAIFGLRDRYTGDSKRKPPNQEKIDGLMLQISNENKIQTEVVIAREEIEAWFLATPEFFKSLHSDLTLEKIGEIVDFDFENGDIESIEHPSAMIKKILRSVDLDYRKRSD